MSTNMKVRVLFNFVAQPESSELTISQGEILNVLNTKVGDGWWEGINERGERGLFPAGYIEPIEDRATETIPKFDDGGAARGSYSHQYPSAGAPQVSSVNEPPVAAAAAGGGQAEEPDWPEEDWDDDEDSDDNTTDYGGPQAGRPAGFPVGTPYYGSVANQSVQQSGIPHGDLSVMAANMSLADDGQRELVAGGAGAFGGQAGKPVTKKNFNRFSNFVKSGLESYILGTEKEEKNVTIDDVNWIESDPELGIIWKPQQFRYTCAVTTHGKESKMKGLKTYISYDVKTSMNNVVVRRRYKHFDWLMQRLEEKFIATPLPPLPEKQIAGRFQEDFVEHRRNLLQLWVNYIIRHPTLSKCDVWKHFMTCRTDDMKGWKLGKRKAEKDEFVGANFFHTIGVQWEQLRPAELQSPDPVKVTKQIDNFQRFVAKLDKAVTHLFTTTVDQSKKFSTAYAKDYKKLSESIKELSSAFQSGTAWRNSLSLNEAIRQTSAAYEDIGRLHEEEPKHDFEPMADVLHQYRGLLAGWPDILQLHKNVMNTQKEQSRLWEEGKVSQAVKEKVDQRTTVANFVALAEINHFHNERLIDFKQMLQVFLTAQINFHSDVLGKLQSALNKINDA